MSVLRRLLRTALLLVLPTLAVCVLLLEVGLRVKGRQPSNQTEGVYEAHGSAYRLLPNQSKVFRSPSFSYTVKTNAFGFRDRLPGPRRLDRPYLAWLGDSATFAKGVEYEESFVGRFAAAVEPSGHEVVNLAVGGHHLSEQEELLRDFLTSAPRKPDGVVVVFTSLLMAYFDQRYRGLVVKNGYLFPEGRWLGPYLVVMAGNASSAYCFFRDGIRNLQSQVFSSGRTAAASMLDTFARSFPALSPDGTRRFEDYLRHLDGEIRAAGATPIHVYLPTTADLRGPELLAMSGRSAADYDLDHYVAALRRESAAEGVQLVDLTAALAAEYARKVPLAFSQDMHYNVRGHAIIAPVLEREILTAAGWIARGAEPGASEAAVVPARSP